MHDIRRILVVVLAICMSACVCLCLATGCAANSSNNQSAQSNKTREVKDLYGRVVTLPESVESCATVGSAARFVVYAGAQDKLVGVTEMETRTSTSRPYTLAWSEFFGSLPATSNGNHLMETSVNGETLLNLKPQVVISSRSAQECDALQEQIKIPVVGISYKDQMFAEDTIQSIMLVGEVLGTVEHAQSVVAKMNEWKADLEIRTAGIPENERPTCFAGAMNYKGAKSFAGTYANYPPFEVVNIVNVADQSGQTGAFEATLEQLGEWNPDYIFVDAANMKLMCEDYAKNRAFFDSLKAFQTGNIYTQPAYKMNGTNIELAICDAYFDGATVYSAAFADVDLAAKYEEILTTMLGVNVLEKMEQADSKFEKIPVERFLS